MSQQIALLVIQLGFILLISKLFGMLAAKCRIPSVMGELIAGIVFGPFCLGSISLPFHGFENGLFPHVEGIIGIPIDPKLYSIASLGAIILLFISGLETDVRTFFKYSVVGTIVGIGGIVFSFICGAAVGMFVLGWDFMDPRCLFLGILCTATSVGISARILSEHRAMDSPEGVTIMAAAVIDDVLGIVCLAIVIGIANVELNGGSMAWGNIIWITVRSFGIWLGVTAIGLLCACRIAGFLKWFKSAPVFAVMAFGMSLILAGLFEQAGLAMIIGAFVMGLSLSKTDVAFKVRSSLTPVYNFLVPVFFVVMGMLVDVRVLLDTNLLYVGLIFAVMAIIGKVVGCFVPAVLMNFNSVGALRIGVGMVPRCEVVLIIAGIAAVTMMKNPALKDNPDATNDDTAKIQQQVPIFDSRLFGIAIIMPLVTALIAPPMLSAALKIKRKGVRHEVKDTDSITTTFTFRTEALTNLALAELVELLRHDGFATSSVTKGVRFIQFRRDTTNFSLEIKDGKTFLFSSSAADIPLINTAIYESLVELHRNLSELKQLAKPDDFKTQITTTDMQPTTEKHPKSNADIPLSTFLTHDNIVINLKAATKAEAIRELLKVINAHTPLPDMEKCYQAVLERENVVSTYLDNGIAMPHARTDGTKVFATAIGITNKGFEYDDGEQHRTQLVILSLCPDNEPGPYLQFISQVALVLSDETKRKAIVGSKTADEAISVFVS